MKIVDQRHLSSDNRYSTQPCLLSILEVDDTPASPAAMATLDQRLLALLPGVLRQRSMIGTRGDADDVPQIVRVVQQVAQELRRLALNEVTVGFVGVVPRMRGRYRLVLPYAAKNAAEPALRIATQMVSALRAGQPFNLQAAVARLRALADRRLAPRAAEVVAA